MDNMLTWQVRLNDTISLPVGVLQPVCFSQLKFWSHNMELLLISKLLIAMERDYCANWLRAKIMPSEMSLWIIPFFAEYGVEGWVVARYRLEGREFPLVYDG